METKIRWRRGLFAVTAYLLTACPPIFGATADAARTDINVVLAVDVSDSIKDPDPENGTMEYRLQKQGIVAALRDADVAMAIEQCSAHGVGLTYLEWSGRLNQRQVEQLVPWTKMSSGDELSRFADAVAERPRAFPIATSDENEDGDYDSRFDRSKFAAATDIDSALAVSHELLKKAPFATDRKVILLSSDGMQNVFWNPHGDLTKTRVPILADDVAISALVILNSEDHKFIHPGEPLDEYFQKKVVGGPGAFVKSVADFTGYAAAFKAVLLREFQRCMF